MRKLVSIIILLGIAWVAKLSYDMWQISRTVPELQQNLLQSEQQYANLNDQLDALQRQIQNQPSHRRRRADAYVYHSPHLNRANRPQSVPGPGPPPRK